MPSIVALHAEKQWKKNGVKDPEEILVRKHIEALTADGFEVAVRHIFRSSLLDGPTLREMMFGHRKRFLSEQELSPVSQEAGGRSR